MPSLPVVKGTLDVLVLRALDHAPMHGFEIATWLQSASHRKLLVEDAAIYQAAYRLEARGLLTAYFGVTDNNRKARYYKITPAGRALLRAETKQWMQYAATMTSILTPEDAP